MSLDGMLAAVFSCDVGLQGENGLEVLGGSTVHVQEPNGSKSSLSKLSCARLDFSLGKAALHPSVHIVLLL